MSLIAQIAVFLGATVLAIPLFRRLRLCSILGYLAAGVVIGPWGLRVVPDVESMMHIAEFGVVLLLFVIGLELQPSRLWAMRKPVFGLGGAQVVVTTARARRRWRCALGLPAATALVRRSGCRCPPRRSRCSCWRRSNAADTPTTAAPRFGILLFQDLAVMPLLAILPLLGSGRPGLSTGAG